MRTNGGYGTLYSHGGSLSPRDRRPGPEQSQGKEHARWHHVGLAVRGRRGQREEKDPGVPEAGVGADPADGQVGAHPQLFSPH